MKIPDDMKVEWEKTKKRLKKLGEEAAVLAQKGEKELVKFSKQSKLQIDSTTLGLKKEKLYYQIGKAYVNENSPSEPTPAIKKLVSEVRKLEEKQKNIKKKIKEVTKGVKKSDTKKSPRKSSVKKKASS